MFDGRWRHGVDRVTAPVGRALVRARVTANVLTVFGLAMSAVTAVVVGSGHLVLGIVMLFPTGLPDLFDGPVAKASGTASARGAFFDSVADRVSDGFLLGGVAWYLQAHHHGQIVLLPFAVLVVTSLISYQRAKADVLGIRASGGLMERAERFVLLGACFLAGAVAASAFVPALWVYFALVALTAAGRFVRVWRSAEGPARSPGAAIPIHRTGTPVVVGGTEVPRRALVRWHQGRVDSRWRAWRQARAGGAAGHEGVRRLSHWPSGEPFGRWRSRRDGVPTSRSGRVWRSRAANRLRERVGRRPGGL